MSVVVGVLLFSGCQAPFKVISRVRFDEYRTLDRLNADQAALISRLTIENERLKDKAAALEAAMRDKVDILKLLQEANMRLEGELRERMAAIAPAGVEGPGEIFRTPEGVGIRLTSDVLFSTALATLTPEGETVLKQVADAVRDKPNNIRVCGYTDSQWTGVSKWDSNFELSGARAYSVLNFLVAQGIEADRMHFAGYGEHALIYNSDGTENMKKSRRAEIILLNEFAEMIGAIKPK